MLEFYYWFEGSLYPELFESYIGDIGDVYNDRKIVDWTYEEIGKDNA